MSYDIVFTPSADIDLQDAFKWYESERPLLGWEFRESFSRSMDRIMDERIDYQVYSGNIRFIRLVRFPYKVYYIKDTEKKQITVLAVFHFKKNPGELRNALE